MTRNTECELVKPLWKEVQIDFTETEKSTTI